MPEIGVALDVDTGLWYYVTNFGGIVPIPIPPEELGAILLDAGDTGPDAAKLAELGLEARFMPGFQPIPGGSTWCSKAAWWIAKQMGVNVPILSANDQYLYITDPAHGWINVSQTEAQQLANAGYFVIGVSYSKTISPIDNLPHGHTVVVMPGEMRPNGQPSVLSMGRHPYLTGIDEERTYSNPKGMEFYCRYDDYIDSINGKTPSE